MARGRRKVNTGTLDAKIEQQKAALEKAKAKYEAEKETLAALTDRWAAERIIMGIAGILPVQNRTLSVLPFHKMGQASFLSYLDKANETGTNPELLSIEN